MTHLFHQPLIQDYLDAALKTALQIHKYTDEGDVLIFLPGQDEIEDVASLLKKHLEELEPDDSQETARDIVQNIKGIGTSINSGNTMIVNGVLICVLYAALPPDAQMNAFRPKPDGCVRKIILSTNIAGNQNCCVECPACNSFELTDSIFIHFLVCRDIRNTRWHKVCCRLR